MTRPWFGRNADHELGPRFRTWGNVRITSVPQQINSSVAEFSANLVNRLGELKVNEVAQAAEFLAGIDYRLWVKRGRLISFSQNERARTSFSLIGSVGAITLLNPKDGTELFKVPAAGSDAMGRLIRRYGTELSVASNATALPSGITHIAFTPLDRERFFRQYYGGLRLQTHYLALGGQPRTRPPHTLDLMIGRNEALTGGRFKGAVGRIEAFYALPFAERYVYMFFGAQLRLQREPSTSEAIILDKPGANETIPSLTNASVRLLSIPANSRDMWRVGVGIDFVSALRSWIDAAQTPR